MTNVNNDNDDDVSSFFPRHRPRNILRLTIEGKKERQKEEERER